ncbi:alpha-tubulin suppressor protein-like protein Aats1 [Plenodomus tracheiphilus IPT5]|uniref:Alpha-tubulin suppressor protein-like protein Aats1 n=1 Tax=Plenodomus tracheiphilus IPT5 TaxID=1408161 RepID=A0A6A7B9Y2_9PLEO|nr:alpha-tubulin suppressor protein-like protein Aats1 [Plenodomus tracheiphilus IPT5]
MPRQLYVFGSNGEGQLGIPAADIVNTPTLIKDPLPLQDLLSIHCGDNHTLLQISTTNLYGTGSNRKGQIAPHRVINNNTRLEHFTRLETGGSFVAATCESSAYIHLHLAPPAWVVQMNNNINSLGFPTEPLELVKPQPFQPSTWIWTEGYSHWGEMGRGDQITSTADDYPGVDALREKLWGVAVDFAAGVWHYVVIFEDGTVYGWGKARLGQLGDGLDGKVTVPTKIEGIPFKPKKVVCGKDFTYVVGDPQDGEHVVLGRDKFNIVSGKPDNIKGWKDIGATWHAIFVLFNDGTLLAWGKENMWKLVPPNLPLLEKIAVGSDHVLALTVDGKLISWGWGKHGNCGDLSRMEQNVENDMVSGFWNEIDIPGTIEMIAAGFCTSFVVTQREEVDERG